MIRNIVKNNWSAKYCSGSKQRFIFFLITAKMEDNIYKKTDCLMEKRSLTILFNILIDRVEIGQDGSDLLPLFTYRGMVINPFCRLSIYLEPYS